jgi:hypothetical protein
MGKLFLCSLAATSCLVLAGCLGSSDSPSAPAPVNQTQISPNEVQQANDGVNLATTPKALCGPGARPESGLQGRVSQADFDSGRAAAGFACNAELVGSYDTGAKLGYVGGYKVERYVDTKGQECAYYDTALIAPLNVLEQTSGVHVMDMSDPTKPRLTKRLLSPAMLSPHESLLVNTKRGVLAAVVGNPVVGPGIVDLYDIKNDCLNPKLKSSTPLGLLGHESGMTADGNTFYVASPATTTIVALDISNLSQPKIVWSGFESSHGLSLDPTGNRAYLAALSGPGGLVVLDTSEIQARKPNPTVKRISALTWDTLSLPQNAMPVTFDGKPHIIEFDEFASGGSGLDFIKTGFLAPALKVADLIAAPNGPLVGAGRIIDISDETRPAVVSNIRLQVHDIANREVVSKDPGAENFAGGYAAHYCNVPTLVDPPIMACSMILSGLRVFDIRDPKNPKEIAYFVAPVKPRILNLTAPPSNYAMARPTFVPERKEIWYSDVYQGFFVVRLTNGVW